MCETTRRPSTVRLIPLTRNPAVMIARMVFLLPALLFAATSQSPHQKEPRGLVTDAQEKRSALSSLSSIKHPGTRGIAEHSPGPDNAGRAYLIGGAKRAGTVYLYSGATNDVLRTLTSPHAEEKGQLGRSWAVVKNVNTGEVQSRGGWSVSGKRRGHLQGGSRPPLSDPLGVRPPGVEDPLLVCP